MIAGRGAAYALLGLAALLVVLAISSGWSGASRLASRGDEPADDPAGAATAFVRVIPAWLARRQRLGFSDGRQLVPYLKRRRFSLRRARELGLLFEDESETMAGRLVIPDLRGGHSGWMVGRATGEGRLPKYRGLALPRPLLGYERGRRRVLVTEGPFDWLTLLSWGLPACALLGTQAGRGVLRLFERARSIVLVMDGDGPGRDAAAALAAAFGDRARVLELPLSVKDINELAAQPEGRETFFGLLDAGREGRDDSHSR